MKITLQQYKKYRGKVGLTAGEAFLASNNTLQSLLTKEGFSNVAVTGSGRERVAEGVWSKPTQEKELPKQVVEINQI